MLVQWVCMKLIENWFSERYSDNLQLSFRVKDQLLSVRTDFQRIDVFDTYDFGKLLSIDGTVQLTERDEFVYHEMITMMPFVYSKVKPEKALIIGGGDGGAAGELAKLGLKRIVNVEIDGQVIEVCRKHFPDLVRSFTLENVELIVGDGIKYARTTEEKFDIIIVDSTDPVGPAEGLFNESFYKDIKKILNTGGVVVTQSGSPFYQPTAIGLAHKGMKPHFAKVKSYTAFIPTYPSGFWSFTMASDHDIGKSYRELPAGKYFNKEISASCFSLPEFVKTLIT